MTNTEKDKPVKLGGMQTHTRDLFNKGIGSEGTCSTAAATAAKEVTLGTTFELVSKATILVKFTNEISVASATLAVTHTDLDGTTTTETAKPIYYRGAALAAGLVKAGDEVMLRYDGTSWNIIGIIDQDLSGKQDVISDLSDIRSGAGAGATAYQKPSGGIPSSDMTSGVQTSLGLADTSVQAVTYDTTNKKLTKTVAGTTTDIVTSKKIVEDGGGVQMNLLNLFELTHDYTFKVNDTLCLGGALYRCTEATTTPPFDFVFDANNSIVYDAINGQEAVVMDSDTLNTGWEKVIDVNDRYYTEQRLLTKADKATTLAGYNIADAYTKTQIDALTRHTRLTDFDLATLKQAVADQNLEKYGLKVGDQKTINGHDYVIAGLNPMKGTLTPYCVTANHVGLIVIPHTAQPWNASGNTYTGADSRGGGYMNSDLHYYLKNTVLPMCNTDLGAANLLGHDKLLTNEATPNSYNRTGTITGRSSNRAWEADCKISALSEVQVYGSIVWSSCGYDTGEADQQLEVFKHYKHTEIFGNEFPWLRDIVSGDYAASAGSSGIADYYTASDAHYVAALVLFH